MSLPVAAAAVFFFGMILCWACLEDNKGDQS
jgi:hypothetical protein